MVYTPQNESPMANFPLPSPRICQPKSPNTHEDYRNSLNRFCFPISPFVLPEDKPWQIDHLLQRLACLSARSLGFSPLHLGFSLSAPSEPTRRECRATIGSFSSRNSLYLILSSFFDHTPSLSNHAL
uniref:Uncharacterized protein n=1 Tax=Cucumis sativus TaxID=3659 RepID=A0A0A0K615_CUCSA